MIPDYTKEAIDAYVSERRPPGGFLTAVLTNNLKESFAMADDNNREAMYDIVCYCYNDIPGKCWGSKKAVRKWLSEAP